MTTANFGLPVFTVGEPMPEVKYNIALAQIVAIVQGEITDHLAALPARSDIQESHLLTTTPSGPGAGHGNALATWWGSEYFFTNSLINYPKLVWDHSLNKYLFLHPTTTNKYGIVSDEDPTLNEPSISNPPTQSEVQDLQADLNSLITAAQGVGVIG